MGLIDLGSLFHPPGYPGVLPFFWREQQPNYLIVIFKTVESAISSDRKNASQEKQKANQWRRRYTGSVQHFWNSDTWHRRYDAYDGLTCFEREWWRALLPCTHGSKHRQWSGEPLNIFGHIVCNQITCRPTKLGKKGELGGEEEDEEEDITILLTSRWKPKDHLIRFGSIFVNKSG